MWPGAQRRATSRHITDHRSSSDVYCPDLLLLNARRIQAFLQQQEFLKAFDASELFLRLQEPGSRPTQRLISFSPALYVPRHALHRRQTRFDRVGGRQFSPQYRSDTQAMYGQRLFQPLLEASCRARIDPFQLPEDFLQHRFGLRVVVHRIRVAHPSVVVLLAVLRQILLSHSVVYEFGSVAPPLVRQKLVPPRRAALSIRRSPPDTVVANPVRDPPDLPTAL